MERWRQPPALEVTESSFDCNAPLRSARGNGAAPSPFYKLSSELSRESLRIPGAVPFIWEQTPGRRKFAASAGNLPTPSPPPPPETSSSDPTKPTLAALFQQPSPRALALPSPVSSAIPQIAAPPAADHPRSSSARYSVVQRTPPPVVYNDDDASSDATSDALTATAGGASVDDSFVSGAVGLASTASDARDFIMLRFLPAAHAIACDSPQMPGRRFMPPEAASPSRSSVDARPSPLRYNASTPTTPALSMRALPAPSPLAIRSQHPSLNSEDYDDDDEQPAASMRACGMFTYRIRNALLHFHHRASPSRSKQQHKKSSKKHSVSSGPRRLIDILSEDASDDDDNQSKQKAGKMVVIDRAMPPRSRLIETNYRARPLNHHLMVLDQQADLPMSLDESSNYYDAPSRFSPAAPAAGTTKAAAMNSSFHSKKFTQPAIINYDLNLNNNKSNTPNPVHPSNSASVISSKFDTPRASASGDHKYVDAEQNALYNYDNLQQKPRLNNGNGHDEDIIKGTNWPIPISVNCVATSCSRLSEDGRLRARIIGDQPSSPASLLSPPLPKSPTQSWLGRAIPPSTRIPSPLSHMHRAPPPEKEYSLEDSKWEAIVKGSHVKPGHLRFSEELLHKSQDASMKVSAT